MRHFSFGSLHSSMTLIKQIKKSKDLALNWHKSRLCCTNQGNKFINCPKKCSWATWATNKPENHIRRWFKTQYPNMNSKFPSKSPLSIPNSNPSKILTETYNKNHLKLQPWPKLLTKKICKLKSSVHKFNKKKPKSNF